MKAPQFALKKKLGAKKLHKLKQLFLLDLSREAT